MPQRDPGVYLEDIEHYADAAVRFIATFSLDQYLADEKTRAAVERVLEICGGVALRARRLATRPKLGWCTARIAIDAERPDRTAIEPAVLQNHNHTLVDERSQIRVLAAALLHHRT